MDSGSTQVEKYWPMGSPLSIRVLCTVYCVLLRPTPHAYRQRLATSVFMNVKASAASWCSVSYMQRQIFVAATILSKARPKALTTIRLS